MQGQVKLGKQRRAKGDGGIFQVQKAHASTPVRDMADRLPFGQIEEA